MVGPKLKSLTDSLRLVKFDGFLVGIILGTLIFWGAFGSLLFFSSPESAGLGGLAIFYTSLICGLTGIFYLVGINIRKKFSKSGDAGLSDFNSLRQALLISLFFVGLLGLAKLQILNFLTVALVFGTLGFFELFLRAK